MGLYEDKILPAKGNSNKNKIITFAIIGVIAILLIIFLINFNWSKIGNSNNLSIKFSKNPYNLTKDADLKIILTLKNNSGNDCENTSVAIYPVEEIFFVTCEGSELNNNKVVIPIFAKNATRIISCNLKLIPEVNKEEILSGSYSFDVVYTLESKVSEKRAMLNIKK